MKRQEEILSKTKQRQKTKRIEIEKKVTQDKESNKLKEKSWNEKSKESN